MTTVLGINTSHDGAIALIEDGQLHFSLEAEKDSHERHRPLSLEQCLNAFARIRELPDVIGVGGWSNHYGGYSGLGAGCIRKSKLFGSEVKLFSSSHERSHLIGTYAMSPFEQGTPCYCLLWEGTIGCFYKIDCNLVVSRLGDVLSNPGWRYAYLYYLGLDSSDAPGFWGRMDMAGKLMALAGFNDPKPILESDTALINWILDCTREVQRDASIPADLPSDKSKLTVRFDFVNQGVESARFRNLAWHFSNSLYDIFYRFAKIRMTEKLPLLISGGCGLNCDWNTKWMNSGLFREVFVSPCANDSGSAIGTAIDAQLFITGNAKVQWSVYAGEEFVKDCDVPSSWSKQPLDFIFISRQLLSGKIIAWVQGRAEIGPRALGNRSILAEPFSKHTMNRLNQLKKREGYRPIAPICLEEDVSRHFCWSKPSPYMLYFQKVLDDSLGAVTHDDGTARVQTVNEAQNARVYALLKAFKQESGKGVLCNTSLNFRRRGFINRMSHLINFVEENALMCFVVDDWMFVRAG